MAAEWKDTSSWSQGETDRSEPNSWDVRLGVFRLKIHRHIHYPAGMWLASCAGLFDCAELGEVDADTAKAAALLHFRAKLQEAIRASEDVR